MGNLCFTDRPLQFSVIAHKSLGGFHFSFSALPFPGILPFFLPSSCDQRYLFLSLSLSPLSFLWCSSSSTGGAQGCFCPGRWRHTAGGSALGERGPRRRGWREQSAGGGGSAQGQAGGARKAGARPLGDGSARARSAHGAGGGAALAAARLGPSGGRRRSERVGASTRGSKRG
jgi:hypothetical protein